MLSLTGRRWVLHPRASLRRLPDFVEELLRDRGLHVHANVQPVFPAMQRACERIWMAVRGNEKIAIFGDYDCDGVTATAQMVRFFRRHGIEPLVKLPHRVHDGYGLRAQSIEFFAARGITLLVTVDTGIASIAEVAQARAAGIDVIVTDHHHHKEELPPAFAILHPSVEPALPLPHPSGAGVAFFLVEALEGGFWPERETDEALAMIGTVADLVELGGINRALVRRGLAALRTLHSTPLATLRDRTDSRTSGDVAFRIAPRINAAGRLDDPQLALEALLSGGKALDMLEELNTRRQDHMQELWQETERRIDKSSPLQWCASREYHPGIVGLLAGKLTELTGQVSCVAAIDGDRCVASLRSPPCYNVTQGLERIGGLLLSFGGHARAAGCSFAISNLESVRQHLREDIERHAPLEDLVPTLGIDMVVQPQDVTLDLCTTLKQLEPFGQGNPEPIFLLQNVMMENARTVGSAGTHLQISVTGIKAIGFGLGGLLPQIGSDALDVLCRVQIDTWNGRMQPQLLIQDVRVAVGVPMKA